jgi:hypothetical protein
MYLKPKALKSLCKEKFSVIIELPLHATKWHRNKKQTKKTPEALEKRRKRKTMVHEALHRLSNMNSTKS